MRNPPPPMLTSSPPPPPPQGLVDAEICIRHSHIHIRYSVHLQHGADWRVVMEAGVLASPWNQLEGFGADRGLSVPPGPVHLATPGTGLHRPAKGFWEVIIAVYTFLSKVAYYCTNYYDKSSNYYFIFLFTLFSTVACSCRCRHTSHSINIQVD